MNTFLGWFAFALLIAIITDGELFERIWNRKAVIAMRFSTQSEKVYRPKRPTDCDFLTAPIGIKHCSYEAFITTDPNDGKTVYVNWIRKD